VGAVGSRNFGLRIDLAHRLYNNLLLPHKPWEENFLTAPNLGVWKLPVPRCHWSQQTSQSVTKVTRMLPISHSWLQISKIGQVPAALISAKVALIQQTSQCIRISSCLISSSSSESHWSPHSWQWRQYNNRHKVTTQQNSSEMQDALPRIELQHQAHFLNTFKSSKTCRCVSPAADLNTHQNIIECVLFQTSYKSN